MKQQFLPFIILFALLIAIGACSQEERKSDWHPNTRLLDECAKQGKDEAALAHDVETFYQLLRDKQWHETYQGRAKAFREDTLESDYLTTAKKYEKAWGLVNYEVLHIEMQNSDTTNFDTAILICKFRELPDNTDSYSAVFWHKEDGIWKCLSAGPTKLGIFDATRSPTVDWR